MHRIDTGVPGQVLAHVGAAVDDAQDARLDQRGQGAVPMRHQVVVDRVGLQYHDPALHEELGQHVARAEGGHVAGGEHQRGAGMARGVAVGGGLTGDEGGARHAGLHDDLGRGLGEGHPVEGAGREHLDAQATVGRLADRSGEVGLAVLGDGAQRVTEEAGHAHEGADAGEELLAGFGRSRRETLGGTGGGQPVILSGERVHDDA